MTIVNLKCSDDVVVSASFDVIKCSVTIKDMFDTMGFDEGADEEIPIANVDSTIMKKVVEWATHHKDDLPPFEDEDEEKERRTDDISSWDADFLKGDQKTLFDLVLAANYLDIKGLLDVTCKTIANMIKGKTADEIRKMFNIENDFTPEEEAQIRRENEWLEEK